VRHALGLALLFYCLFPLRPSFAASPEDLAKAADDVKSIIGHQLRDTEVRLAFLPAVRDQSKKALYLHADYTARLIGAGLGAAHAVVKQTGADDLSELVFIWKDRTQVDIIPGEALAEIVSADSKEKLAELLSQHLIRYEDRAKLPVPVQVWLKNPQ